MMITRTSHKTVTFNRPFTLEGYDDLLPAGNYLVETEEAPLDGLSFNAFHRVSCMMNLQPSRQHPGEIRTLILAPAVLDAALARDLAPASTSLDLPGPRKPKSRIRKSA
ncbi:hypothetical protein [Emcibacter sp.]|uniref:hypothetical protein n=1 Tax=Emcibacter sp. TaxID=1979954 RepID=UPI002AA94138|nr:hypothetical protein [Emcibacter sp.]